MAGEIVVGYDGTELGKAALDVGCDLALATGAPIVVVYGYEPYHGGGEIGTHRQVLYEMGEKATDEAVATARGRGVEAEVELVADRPAPALAEVAEQRGARLIAVGGFGEAPLKGAILGSTPYKLLHLASVPVLVIPISH
jgi:nucleotide-binding universal stress UspA family protein